MIAASRAAFALALLLAASCVVAAQVRPWATEPVAPLPAAPQVDPRKAALGALLWNDRRLAPLRRESCASCHDLATNGATARALDPGEDGETGRYNTPTIFNVAHLFRYEWRGQVTSLAEMVRLSLQSGDRTGVTEAIYERRLRRDPRMRDRFRAVYGREPDRTAIIDALTVFLLELNTPNSPFDRWLAGDRTAISAEAQRGYTLFRSFGCVACHQGAMIGANMYQRPGIFHAIGRSSPSLLRVPSLRNVAVTAPYFHDGHVATLDEAIRVMGQAQLDRGLSPREIAEIAAFLKSLTGQYRGRPLRPAATPRAS